MKIKLPLILLILVGLGYLSFFVLEKGINLNLLDLWWKFNDFVEYNMERGGWHRALTVGSFGLVMYVIIITFILKKKDER